MRFDDSPLLPMVTCPRELPRQRVPVLADCFVVQARQRAQAADLVVVNHHLLLADLALATGASARSCRAQTSSSTRRTSSPRPACSSSARILGSSQLIDFARDMLGVGLQQARGLVPWPELAAACDRSARDLRLAAVGRLGEVRASLKLRWGNAAGTTPSSPRWRRWARLAARRTRHSKTVSELAPDFVRLGERTARLASLARTFAEPPEDGRSAGWTSARSRRASSNRRSTSATR